MSTTIAPAEAQLITGAELLALGDIGPCELIDGRIVAMTPPGAEHGEMIFLLGETLGSFVAIHHIGHILIGGTGIYVQRNPDRVRGMDIAFISYQRMPGPLPKTYLEAAPELVVESVSPNDLWSQVRQKIAEYFAIGVERVWIVEPETRSVLVYSSPTTFTQLAVGDTLTGEGALGGFSLPLAELFAQ